MPSSISSSDRIFPRKAIGWTLLLLIVVAGCFEVLARTVLVPASRFLRRKETEFAEAVRLRRTSPAGQKTLLIAGNSLLLEDVDHDALRMFLAAGGWDAHRFVMEQTQFLDWHFGIRRLIEEGSDPEAIVLMLTPEQLMAKSVVIGFPNMLMRIRDLPEVAAATGMHPTEAAGFALGRYSKFYGLRQDLRRNLLRVLIPGMPGLTPLLIPEYGPVFDPRDVEAEVARRMPGPLATATARRIRFALAIPPIGSPRAWEESAARGAKIAGVTVIQPRRSGDLPAGAFRDTFHMTPEAQKGYTAVFAPDLLKWLNSQ